MKNTPEKFDPFSKIEQRLKEIEERMSEIEEKTRKSFETVQEYLVLLNQLSFETTHCGLQVMTNLQIPKGDTSLFDNMTDSIIRQQSIIEAIKEKGFRVPPIEPRAVFGIILILSKKWNIPFDEAASYLIQKLGKEYVRQNVPKEAILRNFGSGALGTWKALFEE